MEELKKLFNTYYTFLDRIDTHIKDVETKFQDDIVCKKGCDECCKFLTLFPVEAFNLAETFSALPHNLKQKIKNQIQAAPEACPLLVDSQCMLYPHRPIICRTHGIPIYMEKQGQPFIDFCPKNFKGITDFPKQTLLSIENLNTTLTAINKQFIENIETDMPMPDRIPISQALFLFSD